MARPRRNRKNATNHVGVSIRHVKRELKLIPNDIKREMRFLDLLFAERNLVRTQAEREVLREFIESAKGMIEFHQNRLERYQKFYDQLKARKSVDPGLLQPDELRLLQGPPSQKGKPDYSIGHEGLRTGTDG